MCTYFTWKTVATDPNTSDKWINVGTSGIKAVTVIKNILVQPNAALCHSS